jgi:hypothetical protein
MGHSITFKGTLSSVPAEIVNIIEREYIDLESRFSRRDWSPGELNGARFAEAIFRYLEWKDAGLYTPIGTPINRQEITNRVSRNVNIPDGLRFHALSCAGILLDIRNKRDVAHLGTVINVYEMDSRLVLGLAKWVLSEIVRVESRLDPSVIQAMIDKLSAKNVSLIDEIDGDKIFIGTHLDFDSRVLITLYNSYPEAIDIKILRQIVRYSHSTKFRDNVVSNLSKDGRLHLKGEKVFITSKGVAWVEKYANFQLDI